jgi:hypothetical protein
MSSDTPAAVKRARADPLDVRTSFIDLRLDTPAETRDRLNRIRDVISRAAREVTTIIKESGKYDMGRAIAAVDSLQHAKDLACASVLLPFAEDDVTSRSNQ